MTHRIEIFTKSDYQDVPGQEVLTDIRQLGISTVEEVQAIKVFLLGGDFDQAGLERIARELLADPISQECHLGRSAAPPGLAQATLIEVHLKPGVTDPVADSTRMALADMGLKVKSVRTARKYIVLGHINEKQKQIIAQKILANDCIEEVIFGTDSEPPSPHTKPYQLRIINIPMRQLDDQQLQKISDQMDLFLNLKEMQTIQQYYQKLKRDPTDVELEMLAQTWSEHCVHKTFRSTIEFTETNGVGEKTIVIENLLKSTIVRATRELDKPWCISVFEDNAGVVEFDENYGICFKVETHNHPSAIEPYGGAATGIGGVIRDPMGTGLGSKPIANTDIFCFAPPDMRLEDLPIGVLHPRRVMKGVVAGVRDYGNRMGIPTVNGAVLFDERYLGNPLVYCGNIGLIPRQMCFGSARSGDLILMVGGRVGRDGIHGATFSSGEMTHEHETVFSHAVQIGNPIVEKKMLDTLLAARDENLYVAITDCGAGGLSSAVGEMGAKLGAVVDLEKVPLKYQGLSYTEIWISEAQERMVIAVPPENLERIKEIFAGEDVEATVVGQYTADKKLHLRYNGQTVGELDMEFLHEGLPKYTRQAIWNAPKVQEPELTEKEDYTDDLKAVLSGFNVASKEWVIRQYDHEVQGGSTIKPLVGADNDGPGDASVLRPVLSRDQGIAIGCGICPQYSDIDPYWMALAAIDEAVRNVVAVGGNPERIAILDNFCWGNCNKPDRLGSLVKAAQGCYDAAVAFGTPFISGKDSLNNEFQTQDGQTINIPGTLLISAMAIVDDVNRCVTMDAKRPGNVILIVGETKNELGGSQYYQLNGKLGANVPKVNLNAAPKVIAAVAAAIKQGLVVACHDCSEGGLAVALAEMAFAGGVGIEANLTRVPVSRDVSRADQTLFGESATRFLMEAPPENFGRLAQLLGNMRFGEIGMVTDNSRLIIKTTGGQAVIDADIYKLKEAWQKPLRW
ncbi:MAG: phosphoribosylformylglycinamidine synthase [Phycisphaerae bacterium SM23_30]|nr:MAG: phosphoribosylformylglycinamidine synthase [Phycisphaerae bacterium SM23_30]